MRRPVPRERRSHSLWGGGSDSDSNHDSASGSDGVVMTVMW